MRVLKILGYFLLADIILSVGMFLFLMMFFKFMPGASWTVFNPIGNPFAGAIPIITTAVLAIWFKWDMSV